MNVLIIIIAYDVGGSNPALASIKFHIHSYLYVFQIKAIS